MPWKEICAMDQKMQMIKYWKGFLRVTRPRVTVSIRLYAILTTGMPTSSPVK